MDEATTKQYSLNRPGQMWGETEAEKVNPNPNLQALFSPCWLVYAMERLPLIYLVVGRADVLYESAKHGCPVALPHHDVAQELPHEGYVGDMAEEGDQVGCGKRHGVF